MPELQASQQAPETPAESQYREIQGGAKEFNAWGKEHFGEWLDELPDDERLALKQYKSAFYGETNTMLRGLQDTRGVLGQKVVQRIKDRIAKLDAALKRTGVPEDVTVFRGFDHDGLRKMFDDGTLVGTEYSDKAYMSTSVSPKVAKQFARKSKMVAEIRVPKGTRGAYVEGIDTSLKEYELLLARGTKFRVVEARKNKGVIEMVMEVVK